MVFSGSDHQVFKDVFSSAASKLGKPGMTGDDWDDGWRFHPSPVETVGPHSIGIMLDRWNGAVYCIG